MAGEENQCRPLKLFKLRNNTAKEFFSEMLGTFILVLVCDCSIAVQVINKTHDVLSIGIATGMALMLCFYSCAKLSGGHVNPVVTLAFASLGKFPLWKVPHYFAGQYIGGFLATAVAYSNHYSAISMFDGGVRSAFFNGTSTAGIFTSHPAKFLPLEGVVIDQIICVGLLQLGIMCIVDHNNLATPLPTIPIALFVLLAGLITAFGLNCGPALNPARDVPARLFAWMIGYGSEVWNPHSKLYWLIGGLIAPHLGAIVGAYVYHLGVGLHLEPEPESLDHTDQLLLKDMNHHRNNLQNHPDHHLDHVDHHHNHNHNNNNGHQLVEKDHEGQ